MTGEEITEIRESLGMSKKDFADLLGVSVMTVNRWENNRTHPLPVFERGILELKEQRDAKRE